MGAGGSWLLGRGRGQFLLEEQGGRLGAEGGTSALAAMPFVSPAMVPGTLLCHAGPKAAEEKDKSHLCPAHRTCGAAAKHPTKDVCPTWACCEWGKREHQHVSLCRTYDSITYCFYFLLSMEDIQVWRSGSLAEFLNRGFGCSPLWWRSRWTGPTQGHYAWG